MKVSREQMQANRRRILDAAGEKFREKGFDAVSVAEVMKAAGLTHGGFYGHFLSKDDLIAQTLSHLATESAQARAPNLDAFVDAYLSPRHRDDLQRGCPTAALATESRHQSPEGRAAMSDGVLSQIERLTAALPAGSSDERRREAIGLWASMVGAVILARAVEDEALSDEILGATRSWIGQLNAGSTDQVATVD